MRVICLDVGKKRIGVAVSDPLDITAQSIETIQSHGRSADVAHIMELCEQYQTKRVLCGLPLNMDGSEGFQAERVRKLGTALQTLGCEVRYQDERLTTKLATGVLLEADVRREKRKQVVDKLAASCILQSFLDAGGWRDASTGVEYKNLFQSEVWHMVEKDYDEYDDSEAEDLDMEPDEENIVELVDEDENVVRFEHLMTLEHKGKIYICLVPVEPMEDVEEDELVIMRIEQDEDGNDYYTTIEDEKELDEVFEKYCELAEADEEE